MSDDPGTPRPISDALDAGLTEALRKVPDRPGAGRLAVDAALTGWRAEAGHRLSDRWAIGAYVGGGWNRNRPEAGARIQATW